MRTTIHEKVDLLNSGQFPQAIARVPSGWIILGNSQHLRGYCVLFPDPVVSSLNDLTLEGRAEFMRDWALLGDTILAVTDAFRINYEILCNVAPALHAHAFPRYMSEPEARRKSPVWFYDDSESRPFDL